MKQPNRSSKVISVVLLIICCSLFFAGCAPQIIPSKERQKMKAATPTKPVATPARPRKLLVFNLCNGFKHSSIPYCAEAIELMGEKTGAFEVTQSEDMSVFKPENLSRFDAVCLNNTTKLNFDDPVLRKSLMDFVKSGKGIIGIHAAVDNFYDWDEAAEMMGAQFAGHPWTAGGTWAIKIDDPDHPLTASFAGEDFKISDEIYRTKLPFYSRSKQRVLMSLDMTDKATRSPIGVKETDDIGISWVKDYGKGRIFYCSLGHNHHLFWEPKILQHYLAGIQFALGDLSVDTTPVAQLQLVAEQPKPTAVTRDPALDKLLAKIAAYQYGQSREPLTELTGIIRRAYDSPGQLKRIERQLIQFLGSEATIASKQFICRKLSIIGTEESVPALADMLTTPDTSDMARYALERIPGSAVDKALRNALAETDGKVKVGIINSIGERADTAAVNAIAKLLNTDDEQIGQSAAAALGKIAGKKSADALKKALDKASGDSRMILADAYLMCADKALNKGDKKSALAIYKRLYDSDLSSSIRIAALRGRVAADPKKAAETVIDALKADEPSIQPAAIALVREVPDAKIVKAAAAQMPNLSTVGQVQLISALGDRADSAASLAVVNAAKSTELAVRTAALKALATLGDDSSVLLLAEVAAEATGDEKQTARESLYMLSAPDIDKTIVNAIAVVGPKVKAELITAVGQRRISSAAAPLLKTAKDSDADVRLESLKALKAVAGPATLPAIVDLLVNAQSETERTEAEKTVVAVAAKIDNQNRRAKAPLAALDSVEDVKVRCSLLNVLGKIGDNTALPTLRSALRADNTELQAAAIRALSEWPSAEPMDNLFSVARRSRSEIHKVLALRGVIRLIGLGSDRSDSETVELYYRAMRLASNPNEKKMILSGLANVKYFAALAMASNYLSDDALGSEAAAAMVQIARSTVNTHPQQTRMMMQMLIRTSKDDNVKTRAQRIIEQTRKIEKDNAGFTSLFNGADLDNWKIHERANQGKWIVIDSAITGIQDPPGAGGFLCTEGIFKDYEIKLDAKIDWPFDSGVFLRVGPEGKSHQVTLDYRPQGEIGGIYGSGKGGWVEHCPEGINFFKKDQWNAIRIICQGEPAVIQVWVNDTLIMDFQHTDQTTAGTPEEGPICLQIHPGGKGYDKSKTMFRNIRIREL